MLWDDRPAYPMHVWFRLRLLGELDRAALADAWRDALAQHPLLTCHVDDTRGRPHWQPATAGAPEQGPQLAWHSIPPDEAPPPPFDLRLESGTRLDVYPTANGTVLLFRAHHAVTDGLGGCGFLSDLLAHYQARVSPASSPPPSRAPERLRERSRFGLTPWGLARQLPRSLVGLPNGLRFSCLQATPLATRPPEPEPALGASASEPFRPAFLATPLSCTATSALRAAARARGGTLNDLLLTALFQGLARWQQARGEFSPRSRLRINAPVNLRLPEDASAPAMNLVSMLFFDRRGAACTGERDALLAGVQRQMSRNKRFRLGLNLVLMLALQQRLGRLAHETALDRCRATCVLTNLVEPCRDWPGERDADGRVVLGGLTLETLEMFAPLRPHTQAAFTALSYAGRLHLLLHYDRLALAPAAAEQLLQHFAAAAQGFCDPPLQA